MDSLQSEPALERRKAAGVAIRSVLSLAPLRDARLVAGQAGIDRLVRAINVMEVPDILDWVKPDELLLTTAYPLRDDLAALAELVPRLAARGLAGMAIKPSRYIDRIPTTMVEAADRLGFPLIELQPNSSFNEIMGAVLGVILDVQSMRLQHAAEIHDRFTRIVLSGGGLRQIAQALAISINRPVAIVDGQGTLLARTANFAVDRADVAVLMTEPGPAVEPGLTALRLDDGRDAVVQPIRVGAEVHGLIVALADVADLGDDELEALDYAATVAALRQVQARAVAEADQRFQAVCLDELVTGHVTDRGALMERSAAFAWDLGVPRAVLIAEFHAVDGRPFGKLAGSPEEVVARYRLAEAARLTLAHGSIVWERTAGVAALIPSAARSREALRQLGRELQEEAARRLPGSVVDVGIGRRSEDPLHLHESFTEARRALDVARWSHGPGAVGLFEELDLDRLLFSAPESERATFVESAIGPLLRYDAQHQTNLVETLDVFLATRSVATAARSLYVHYNTLANRLQRQEQIIGSFRDDPERCLALGLAVRIRRSPGG